LRGRRLLFRGELCWSTGYGQSRGSVAGSSTRRVAASGRFEWLGRSRGCPPRGSSGRSPALRWSLRCPRALFGVTDTGPLRIPVGHGRGVHDPGGYRDDCPRRKDGSGRSSKTRGDRGEDAAWTHADAPGPDRQGDCHANDSKHEYEDGDRDGNADGHGDRARHGDGRGNDHRRQRQALSRRLLDAARSGRLEMNSTNTSGGLNGPSLV
jgi:hypothetical protein